MERPNWNSMDKAISLAQMRAQATAITSPLIEQLLAIDNCFKDVDPRQLLAYCAARLLDIAAASDDPKTLLPVLRELRATSLNLAVLDIEGKTAAEDEALTSAFGVVRSQAAMPPLELPKRKRGRPAAEPAYNA